MSGLLPRSGGKRTLTSLSSSRTLKGDTGSSTVRCFATLESQTANFYNDSQSANFKIVKRFVIFLRLKTMAGMSTGLASLLSSRFSRLKTLCGWNHINFSIISQTTMNSRARSVTCDAMIICPCIYLQMQLLFCQDLMVKNVKRYMKQQKKDVLVASTPDFVPVTYILPQVGQLIQRCQPDTQNNDFHSIQRLWLRTTACLLRSLERHQYLGS